MYCKKAELSRLYFFCVIVNKEHKGKLIAQSVLRWQCQRFYVLAHFMLDTYRRHMISVRIP